MFLYSVLKGPLKYYEVKSPDTASIQYWMEKFYTIEQVSKQE